jgi:gas vesicle protein
MNPNSKNFDWGKLAMNVGNFAAQNAPNIYNASRYDKPEVEKYERLTGKYLDPTQAIAGENYIGRQTKKAIPGLVGGNAGAAMNLLGANKAGTATRIGRLRETYDNANAQIGNQVNQYNTELARAEVIANAQNRARNRSGKGEWIGDAAKSFAQMQLDSKKDVVDQEALQMYKEYYNNPEFRAAMKKITFGSKKQ